MKTIRSRIITFAVLATLVPAVSLGVLSFWRYKTLISDNVTQELRVLVDYAGSELAQWENERGNEVRALLTSSTVTDALAAANPRSGIGGYELGLYLRSVQSKLQPVLELTVADATGHIIASSASTPSAVTLPSPWPAEQARGFIIESPRWEEARRKATVRVIAPVQSGDNTIVGALWAVVDLATLQPRLQNIARTSSADVVVLAADGKPLVGSHIAESALVPLDPGVLRHFREQPGAPVTFVDHEQREVIGLAKVLPSPPLMIVAERDSSGVYESWRGLLELYLLLVIGLALLLALDAYRLGRAIVTPLTHLLGAANRIAGGDLSVQVRVGSNDEIGDLTRVFNKMTDNLRRSRSETDAANQTLLQQNNLLETLAVRDGLTGLYNRKRLDDILHEQFALYRRTHRPFAVLMLDIDNFKAVNDKEGHLAGDDVLVKVAAGLMQSIRTIDHAARYGGEEFVVVLVDTQIVAALHVAERIRRRVEKTRYGTDETPIAATVSVGVTDSSEVDSPEEMLARADRALYTAKRSGRNRVEAAE